MAGFGALPAFRLPDAQGKLTGTEDYFQRREMVMAILHEACGECAALEGALAQRLRDLWGLGAALLVIVPGAPAHLEPQSPIPRVHDETGNVIALLEQRLALIPGEARLIVADRFGQVHASLPAHGDPHGTVQEILRWVDFIEMQCPECGVPEW
ncbi:MAG: hypothetical protein HY698_21680 [Deltaproteobacteria bacterium]|nr:hypothetical protein [Deltaproteobacteria bacterium]